MSSPRPSHNLQRFLDAQNPIYDRVCAELRSGRKQTHWMWFVFPQIAGLGLSPTARLYAIQSLDEARAFIAHPVLGTRLRECTQFVVDVSGKTAEGILGFPDGMKFRSCMTLFARAAPDEPLFRQALEKYFNAEEDPLTLELLGK